MDKTNACAAVKRSDIRDEIPQFVIMRRVKRIELLMQMQNEMQDYTKCNPRSLSRSFVPFRVK